jgi:adenine phosphoribosyltransferase
MAQIARRFLVHGRVQGVGFRWHTCRDATRTGVSGDVRNLPDGGVEAHAEDDVESLAQLEQAISAGAGGARVVHVDVEPAAVTGIYDSFQVTPYMDLKQHIRSVPDFPKPGILFYDITTLLRIPGGFEAAIDRLSAPYVDKGIDLVVGIESRGFILGGPVAERINAGFVPIRKPGKLPARSVRESYNLEYGTDALEIHADAVERGQRVLIVDDVLATGGTAQAAALLIKNLGGELHGLAFLIELLALDGKAKLPGEKLFSVLQY